MKSKFSTKKVVSNEEFIAKFTKKFPEERLTFLSDYTHNKKEILVSNEFGECLISPNSLMCGKMPSVRSAVDKDLYIKNKFKKVHGENTFDYSKFVYKGVKTKSTIICKHHGEFCQVPNDHLSGKGCSKCGFDFVKGVLTSNTKDFIRKAVAVHGENTFGYDRSNYVSAKTPLSIKCSVPVHDYFNQTPNNHLNGSGCPKCALENKGAYGRTSFIDISKGKKCLFYVIKCFNEYEKFYKIGITKNNVKSRYSGGSKMPYSYEIISEIEGEAGEVWDLELKNKRLLKDFKYTPKIKFKGSVKECFYNVNLLLNTGGNI
jgi:hypothetical protein